MAQKIVQYQAVMQLAQQSPTLFNMPLLYRQMLDVLSIKNAHKLIPLPEDMMPKDPVTENQDILMMKPAKAFQYQDHTAHITVHMSAMKDPKIMQLLQGNPMAQQLQAAMMAHINEHLGFQYRVEIEKQLGMSLPPQQDEFGEDVHMDPEVEARLAPLLAQASQRLLQQNQQQVAAQQAQQQAQDPLVQLQQQDMQIKMAEQKRKAQKDQNDLMIEQERIKVERARIAAQTAMDAAKSQAQMETSETVEKMKMGIDLVKHISEKDKAHQLQNKQLITNVALQKSREGHEAQMKQMEPKQKGE